MQPFTVSTLLTKKEYTLVTLRQGYKKPYYIVLTLLGLVFLVLGTYYAINGVGDSAIFAAGLFLLLAPLMTVFLARRSTFRNPAVQFPIDYTFSDDGIKIKAMTFESSITWLHFSKVVEDQDFLLLQVQRSAYFIKKDTLTNEQIDYIKSKVKNRGK